jgi:alpha-glucosidase
MPWQRHAPHAGFSTAEPWLPADPAHALRAVDVQEAEPNSLLNHTRTLIALRRQQPALRHGSCTVRAADGDVLWLQRGEGANGVHAVFNLGTTPAPWPTGFSPQAAGGLWSTEPSPRPDHALPGGAAGFYRIPG